MIQIVDFVFQVFFFAAVGVLLLILFDAGRKGREVAVLLFAFSIGMLTCLFILMVFGNLNFGGAA